MTQDEIIRMALDAEFWKGTNGLWMCDTNDLERFAALVAAHEREACAILCLQTGIKHPQQTGQEACAVAIRAR